MSTCASLSRALAEPLGGTAATAATWLLLEQAGPWGAKALTESHLDSALGRALDAATAGGGVRVALIRRPGRHADASPADASPGDSSPGGASPGSASPGDRVPAVGSREVIVAHTAPGSSWVRRTRLTDPAELLGLDFAALGAGHHTGLGGPHTGDPLALVCTNGRRDRCCALLGRPLAAELAAAGGCEVWESTHLGGHRFSPNMLVLPYGYAYGRLTASAAKDVLAATAAGRMVPDRCRGRSAWDRPGQTAELAIRDLIGEDRAEVLSVEPGLPAADPGTVAVRVVHADGRAWRVEVAETAAEPPRPESCGKAPSAPSRLDARIVTAL